MYAFVAISATRRLESMVRVAPHGETLRHVEYTAREGNHQHTQYAEAHCNHFDKYCTSTVVAELLTEPVSVVVNDPTVKEITVFNGTIVAPVWTPITTRGTPTSLI